MNRLLTSLILALPLTGCGGSGGEYKATGRSALKLELRAASTEPVEGWEEIQNPVAAERLFLSREAVLSNADVASTGVKEDGVRGGIWAVAVWLNAEGKPKLAGMSKELLEPTRRDDRRPTKRLAMLLDGKVISAPVVNSELGGGYFEIHTGNYDEKEARRVAQGIVSNLR